MVLLLIASLYLVALTLTVNNWVHMYEQALEHGHSIALRFYYPVYLANKAKVPYVPILAGVIWLSGIAVWYLPKKKGLLAWFLIITLLLLPTATVTAGEIEPWKLFSVEEMRE